MPTIPTTFTAPPSPTPARLGQTAAEFNAAMDAMLAWFPTHTSEEQQLVDALPDVTSGVNYNSVSTTSLTIATGSNSLTIETGKLLVQGQFVIVAATTDLTNFMYGQVTSYDDSTGALVVNVLGTSGLGTYASWSIGLAPAFNSGVTPRALTAGATSGTITPDGDNADQYAMPGLTGAVTIAAPSGTPVEGQRLLLSFSDDGTSRALTWNAVYASFGTGTLPSATVAGKTHYVGLVYNSAASKWDAVSHSVEL